MRFSALFTLMAAGSAVASLYPVPGEEETTTTTATTTKYVTVTKCAEGNPDCGAEQPSTSAAPVEPTPEPVPTYAVPEPEPETSSIVIVEETSSALPVYPEPSSSAFYPAGNSTTHVGPTASVPHTTLSQSVPVVQITSTQVVQPTAPPAAETSDVAASGAAGLSLKGGVLAGAVGLVIAALC